MPRKSKYEGGSVIYPVRIPKKEPEQSQAKKDIKDVLKKYETNQDTATGAHQ